MATKITVWTYKYEGVTLYERDIDNLLDFIKTELECMDDNLVEEIEITLSKVQMTEKEYEELPEFEGF